MSTTEETVANFLKDQGGRDLYCVAQRPEVDDGKTAAEVQSDEVAMQEQELAGIVWIHPLQESHDGWGSDLIKACKTDIAKVIKTAQEKKLSKEQVDELMLQPHLLATLASRINPEFRHKGLHTPLVSRALTHYYLRMQGVCKGVIIRLSKSDANANVAFTESGLKDIARFEPIDDVDGVLYLAQRGIPDALQVAAALGIKGYTNDQSVL